MTEHMITYLPTIISILTLAVFSRKTRIHCYLIVALSIASEFITLNVNVTAVVVCSTVLVALILADFLRHSVKFSEQLLMK